MELSNKILSTHNKTSIFFLGQAGFAFKSKSGMLLGLDMYLSCCVERVEGHIGYKRLLPTILNPSDVEFDYLIATHPHFDHFDMDSIPTMMANHRTKLFASVNCQKEVRRMMMTEENITYVKEWDHYEAGDFVLDFVFCDHGIGTPDAVGVVICVDGKKIYITGDTCLRSDKFDEIKKYGLFDVMIAPINGAYGNLNEKECVELSKALVPNLTIPCHYGMFASHGGNPGLFMEYMKKELPDQKFLLMTMGERYDLK